MGPVQGTHKKTHKKTQFVSEPRANNPSRSTSLKHVFKDTHKKLTHSNEECVVNKVLGHCHLKMCGK